MDQFDMGLLVALDSADGHRDEEGMWEAAESSWEVWTGNGAGWEMGKMAHGMLDFDMMDKFMEGVLKAIEEHGLWAVHVREYIMALLTKACATTNSFVFLQATAASFKEAWHV
ncbi:hypothetical protein C0995_008268 [Termitomyces sp. Mi166|nr:hypothetical protein C0995_008268 [Termitomyces sp. Mi166\